MANFNDLPKPVRERIYALHLEHDGLVTAGQHSDHIQRDFRDHLHRAMPPLLRLSRKTEKEAAPFYYANNHFVFNSPCGFSTMAYNTWPRHLSLVRKVTCTWDESARYATEGFNQIPRYKGLEQLYIRVDEMAMLKKMLWRYNAHQRAGFGDPTPQQQLAILRYPGMLGLLRLSDIPQAQFVKKVDRNGEEYGGPIPGGVLETQVATKIMRITDERPHP